MDLTLDETQTMIQKTAREYATRVIMPSGGDRSRGAVPEGHPQGARGARSDGGERAEELGGAAAGPVAYALAMQEVSRACASTAVTMAVTNMVGEVIAAFGSAEQKQRYNPKLASGEYAAGAFALSEPVPAGSGRHEHHRDARRRLVGAERPEAVDSRAARTPA